MSAREYLEVALAVINRPIPTSYYGIVTGLMWTLFSHVLFQVCEGVRGWEASLGCACLHLFYLPRFYFISSSSFFFSPFSLLHFSFLFSSL